MERFKFSVSTILFLIVSTIILLIYSLGYSEALEFIKYFSYLYSSFSLMVVIFNIKRFYLYLKEKITSSNIFLNTKNKLYKNKHVKRYFEDIRFKTLINLSISSVFNFSFIFIKFTNGVINKSVWFISLAVYYFLLTSIKLILFTNLRKYNKDKEFIIYKNVGYFLMLLNILLVVMIVQMVISNISIMYPEYFVYLIALYSFYLIISAIVNLIRYRKYNSPILSSIKVINLLAASVSILMLQTIMITTFGENFEYKRLMNSLTGGAISIITLGISTYMIINGQNKMKSTI